MFHIFFWQEEIQEGQDHWEETISRFLSLSDDLGIGSVCDNHLIPYKFWSEFLNLVQTIYVGFSVVIRMMSDVFSCSVDDFRCFQMITNVGCCIFSRSSQGVLLMF